MYKCALSAVPNQKATIRSRHDRLWCTKVMKKSQHHAEKFTSTSERPVEWIFKRLEVPRHSLRTEKSNARHVKFYCISEAISPQSGSLTRTCLDSASFRSPPETTPLSPLAGFPEIRDCAGAVRTGGKTGREVGDCNNEKR